MGRRNAQIEGQMCLEMYLSPQKYVVQANSLVSGKQKLSANAAKLLRASIMQIEKDDSELQPYVLNTSELCELLHIKKDNVYRVINDITDELLHSTVEAREEGPGRVKFKKINWVSYCEYDSNYGVAIKLNSDMKPYLIGLQEYYTQYTIENILSMKSEYGIRLFEIIQEKIGLELYPKKVLPYEGINIELSVQYIRECCGCENKYERWSQFKGRVIDRGMEEINIHTGYRVRVLEYRKSGKAISSIVFHINTRDDSHDKPQIEAPKGVFLRNRDITKKELA